MAKMEELKELQTMLDAVKDVHDEEKKNFLEEAAIAELKAKVHDSMVEDQNRSAV